MPKKTSFEKDLIDVKIRRKDHDRFKGKRYGMEPMYSTVRRLLDEVESNETHVWLIEAQQNVFKWKERALNAEEKLANLGKKQQTLEILN